MNTSNLTPPAVAAWKLWLVASILAACETWINVHASIGLNWAMSVWATILALIAVRVAARASLSRERLVALALACLIAGGAAVTASAGMLFLIVIGTAWAFALAARPDDDAPTRRDIGTCDLLLAPLTSARAALEETTVRIQEATLSVGSSRAIPVVRGILFAAPITLVFALLISSADPLLQYWRTALLIALEDGSFLIRTLWFGAFGLIALGLVGTAPKIYPAEPAGEDSTSERRTVGSVEREIILASVASLFALFLIVQLSHLFANTASIPGSGVTYAQAEHEGFGELTIAASLCAALLIGLSRRSTTQPRRPVERIFGAILVVESQLLLLSAFYKVDLYENVYGFTELRLLVQVYAAVIFIALGQLGLQILGNPDFRQLARHWAVTAATALIGLIYWNHAAWIARANFERYEARNTLDLYY